MPKLVTVIAIAAMSFAAQGAVAQSSASQREQRQEQRQDRREQRQERREERQDGPRIAAPEIDTSNGTKALALLIAAVLLTGEALRRRHLRRKQ